MTDETKGTETPLTERLRKAVCCPTRGCDRGPSLDAAIYERNEAADEIDRLTALVATEKERADKLELAHSASTLSERPDLTEASRGTTIALGDGKYTFRMDGVSLFCDRYGAPWRDFIGDHAVTVLFDYTLELATALAECAAALESSYDVQSYPGTEDCRQAAAARLARALLTPESGQAPEKSSEPDDQTAALLSEREQVKELREATIEQCEGGGAMSENGKKTLVHTYPNGVTDPDADGWHYGMNPSGEGDGRKLVTLEQGGMVWVGIRHWQSAYKRWVNNGEPIAERVIAWQPIPTPAVRRFVHGLLT